MEKKDKTEKVEETPVKKSVNLKINKNFIAAISTLVLVVGVAILSFFLAYSLKGDLGTSIPNDYSRYIAKDYIIGFPPGWAVVPSNLGTFGATGDDLETGDVGGSISITDVVVSDFITDNFKGVTGEGCQQLIDFISNNQPEDAGEFEINKTMIKINKHDACQVDIVTESSEEDRKEQTRIIMIDNPSTEDSEYLITGVWTVDSDHQEDVELSLRTFKLLDVEKEEDNEATEEDQDTEDESNDDEDSEETEDQEESEEEDNSDAEDTDTTTDEEDTTESN